MATSLSREDADQLRTYERDRHTALAEGYIGFFSPVTALAIAPLLEAVRLAPGMKLLDVPTGSGALAAEATRRGASVVGLDISSGMIAQARKLHPGIDFRVGRRGAPAAGGWRARCRRVRLRHRTLSLPRGFRRRVPAHAEAGRAHRLLLVGHFGQAAHPGPDPGCRGGGRRHAAAGGAQGPFQPAVLQRGRVPASAGRGRARRHHAARPSRHASGAGRGCAVEWRARRPGAHLVADRRSRMRRRRRRSAPRLERKAAVYKTPRGLELPVAFRVGAGRKPG